MLTSRGLEMLTSAKILGFWPFKKIQINLINNKTSQISLYLYFSKLNSDSNIQFLDKIDV